MLGSTGYGREDTQLIRVTADDHRLAGKLARSFVPTVADNVHYALRDMTGRADEDRSISYRGQSDNPT
jgi:hypothetical protein